MRTNIIKLVIYMILIVFFAMYSNANEKSNVCNDLEIKIKSEVSVNGKMIHLGDIAELSDCLEQKGKIKKIYLGRAPKLGKKKIFNKKDILSKINSKKWLPENLIITIPKYVVIKRSFQTILAEKLEKLFKEIIKSKLKDKEYKVENFKIFGKLKYPQGKISLPIINNIALNPDKIRGNFYVNIAVKISESLKGNIKLSGFIQRYGNVVCLTKDMSKKNIISKDDIILKKINITKTNPNVLTSANKALGMALRRDINDGTILRKQMLSKPVLIHKGDLIKLIATNGNISIATSGIAQSDGEKGKQISVQNLSSKKKIIGFVKDSSTVEILF